MRSSIRNLIGSIEGFAMDRYLGIRTNLRPFDYQQQFKPGGKPLHPDPVPYQTKMYYMIRSCLKSAALSREDVFYDVGCGTGRILCYVARYYAVQKCVGVELDEGLAMRAAENARRLRVRNCPIEVRCGDAATQDYTDGTVFFLFNPFGAGTMGAFLNSLADTMAARPRSVRVVYMNPQWSEVFKRLGWRLESRVRIPTSPLFVEVFAPPGAAEPNHLQPDARGAVE